MAGKLTPRILTGIPTTSNARQSRLWWQSYKAIQWPLGSNMAEHFVEDKPIAAARNELCELAIQGGYDYLFTISDDVLVPPHTVLEMLDKIGRFYPDERGNLVQCQMITGVYWTKTTPSEAYIYRDLMKGWYRDWKEGDFFLVDFAGMDCLLIDVAMLRELRAKEPDMPFFSTDWQWHDNGQKNSLNTEDYWFYTHARKHGYRLWCDSAIQCAHEDRHTGHLFSITDDMPQAGRIDLTKGELLVADIGAGGDTPFFGRDAKVVRFDIRESVKPDVRCDVLHIPEDWQNTFDIVHARHILEHINRHDMEAALRGWANLLKDGGKLIVRVPNLGWAFKTIQEAPDGDPLKQYAWQQIYGGQSDLRRYDHHATGFTAKKLEMALRLLGCFSDVTVETEDNDLNLKAVGTFKRPRPLPSFEAMWDQIRAQESGVVVEEANAEKQPAGGPDDSRKEEPQAASAPVGGEGEPAGEEVSGAPGL